MQSSEALLRTYLVWDEALVAHGDGGLRGLDALGELGVDAARVGEARTHRHGPRRRLGMDAYVYKKSLPLKNALLTLTYCSCLCC